jgi:hypothetical protein
VNRWLADVSAFHARRTLLDRPAAFRREAPLDATASQNRARRLEACVKQASPWITDALSLRMRFDGFYVAERHSLAWRPGEPVATALTVASRGDESRNIGIGTWSYSRGDYE